MWANQKVASHLEKGDCPNCWQVDSPPCPVLPVKAQLYRRKILSGETEFSCGASAICFAYFVVIIESIFRTFSGFEYNMDITTGRQQVQRTSLQRGGYCHGSEIVLTTEWVMSTGYILGDVSMTSTNHVISVTMCGWWRNRMMQSPWNMIQSRRQWSHQVRHFRWFE